MHGGGLHKRGVHRRHGLAAILPMMASGRTGHRVAALHRLLRVGCGSTVEGIRCERGHEQWQQNWFCESHGYKFRRVQRLGQVNQTRVAPSAFFFATYRDQRGLRCRRGPV